MTPANPHTHHWVIATANGPTSMGKCKRCKETKRFDNSIGYDTAKQSGNVTLFASNGKDNKAAKVGLWYGKK
tara:strand:+ start:1076 stop:1291 length:216 start_codon:yes stop_codon:yes gene_type:complete